MRHRERARVRGYCCLHWMPIGSTAILSWCHLLTHLASPPALLTPSGGLGLSLVPIKSHSPSPKAPAQTLKSQLHRQGGETAENHPILLLFKYRLFPWPLLQRLTPNKVPGGWGLPSHSGYIGENISTLPTWAGNHM